MVCDGSLFLECTKGQRIQNMKADGAQLSKSHTKGHACKFLLPC